MRLAAFQPRVRTLSFQPRVRTLNGLGRLGCNCKRPMGRLGRRRFLGDDSDFMNFDPLAPSTFPSTFPVDPAYGTYDPLGVSSPVASPSGAPTLATGGWSVSPTVVTASGQVMPTFSQSPTVNQNPPSFGAATATALVPSSIPGGSTISVAPQVAVQAATSLSPNTQNLLLWGGGGLLLLMLLGGGGKRRR